MESQKEAAHAPFSTLHHVMIVVKDMEKAVKYFESIGIGPFKPYPPLQEYENLKVEDEDAFYRLIMKEANIGPVVLQLCQPGPGKSIYRDFLERSGEGVQHLGFEVDDIEKEEEGLRKKGLKVLSSGRRSDGSGFTYFDTEKDAGVTLLIRKTSPQKAR
ncbi:MAG: VOC family protein [Candidatus Desulfacyla sp.]|jgi:methylmalonyl-CoA/ethylmalonyl-CoA epimerase